MVKLKNSNNVVKIEAILNDTLDSDNSKFKHFAELGVVMEYSPLGSLESFRTNN